MQCVIKEEIWYYQNRVDMASMTNGEPRSCLIETRSLDNSMKMKKNRVLPLILLGILMLSASFLPPPPAKKAAYKLHYQGSLHYREGNVSKAISLFQRAYDMEPDNFTFAFSPSSHFSILIHDL